jgi:hypothetical protein
VMVRGEAAGDAFGDALGVFPGFQLTAYSHIACVPPELEYTTFSAREAGQSLPRGNNLELAPNGK